MKRFIGIAAVLCLTLGLAPFRPEPHLIGKIRWLAGGGEGMQLMDYLDLLFHASPFVLLVVLVGIALVRKMRKAKLEG